MTLKEWLISQFVYTNNTYIIITQGEGEGSQGYATFREKILVSSVFREEIFISENLQTKKESYHQNSV